MPIGQENGNERCISNQEINSLRQKYLGNDAALAKAVQDESCLVCQTFGSSWLASHVQVRDLLVDPTNWFGQYQVRDGVAIDRDKGTAVDKALYNYETVPAGTPFECQIILENTTLWQRGLFWLALQPFIMGEAALGGFTSRGLGWVKLEEYELRLIQPDSEPAALIEALMGSGLPVEKAERKKWVKALEKKLTNKPKKKEAQNAQAAAE